MEFEKVFTSIGITLIVLIGFFTLIQSWNTSYGTSVGTELNSTYTHIETLTTATMYNMSVTTGNATITSSGGSDDSTQANLVKRSLQIITNIPELLGLVPALFNDFSTLLGIPPIYREIATWLFIFSFVVLFAYLLLIGARRLL